jgi:hypothetical protein
LLVEEKEGETVLRIVQVPWGEKTFELLVSTLGEIVLAFWDTYVFGFVDGVITDFVDGRSKD